MSRVFRGWRRTVPLLVMLLWPGAGYGQDVASWWRDLRSSLSNSQSGESIVVAEDAIDPELRGGRLGAAGHDLLRRLDHLLAEQSSPLPPHEEISTAPSGQNPAATQGSPAESALDS